MKKLIGIFILSASLYAQGTPFSWFSRIATKYSLHRTSYILAASATGCIGNNYYQKNNTYFRTFTGSSNHFPDTPYSFTPLKTLLVLAGQKYYSSQLPLRLQAKQQHKPQSPQEKEAYEVISNFLPSIGLYSEVNSLEQIRTLSYDQQDALAAHMLGCLMSEYDTKSFKGFTLVFSQCDKIKHKHPELINILSTPIENPGISDLKTFVTAIVQLRENGGMSPQLKCRSQVSQQRISTMTWGEYFSFLRAIKSKF